MKKIYGLHPGAHFGDIWLFISSAILLSKKNKETIYISRYAITSRRFLLHDRKSILEGCLRALDTTDAKIEIVEDFHNQYYRTATDFPISTGAFLNEDPIVSTKIKHNPKANYIIALQLASLFFDKEKKIYTSRKNSAQNEYRNIPYLELEKIFLNFISFQNLKINSVGEHIGIENSINKIAESNIFIGIDSGMSHIASSVGIPVYLYDFKQNEDIYLDQFHKNKNIKKFKTLEDILNIFNEHGIKYN